MKKNDESGVEGTVFTARFINPPEPSSPTPPPATPLTTERINKPRIILVWHLEIISVAFKLHTVHYESFAGSRGVIKNIEMKVFVLSKREPRVGTSNLNP